jgi:hypothetical protein
MVMRTFTGCDGGMVVLAVVMVVVMVVVMAEGMSCNLSNFYICVI